MMLFLIELFTGMNRLEMKICVCRFLDEYGKLESHSITNNKIQFSMTEFNCQSSNSIVNNQIQLAMINSI